MSRPKTSSVSDQRTLPHGTSISCAATRHWSPAGRMVPTSTASTSRSRASSLKSGMAVAKRAAPSGERTTSDSMPASDIAIASARLGPKNSRSASVRSRRNGSTASRTSVGWRTGRVAVSDVASTARSSLASSAALTGRRSRCFSSARAKERGL